MPRYFFNTENGHLVCDRDGEELQGEQAARVEAVKLMASILRDNPAEFLETDQWRLIVSQASQGDRFAVEVRMVAREAIEDWGRPGDRASHA